MCVFAGRLLIATTLLGTIGSTLCNYPHQIAYFNECSGGADNGWRHMLGSNFDWGQDLLQLRDWLAGQPTAANVNFWGTTGSLLSLFPNELANRESHFFAVDATERVLLGIDVEREYVAKIGVVYVFRDASPIRIETKAE